MLGLKLTHISNTGTLIYIFDDHICFMGLNPLWDFIKTDI